MSDKKDNTKPEQQKEQQKDKKPKENQKDAQVLKLLEEDQDDFQQFQENAYQENPPQRVDPKQWREDWDDEDINDDFVGQLKKQLNA